jgi:hypothetical protein
VSKPNLVSYNFETVTKHEFVRVPNPDRKAGVVHIHEFVPGTNLGSEAGFVTIYEPRF